MTDQQLLAVMTSFVNLGVDLSPLCNVFSLFHVISSFLFLSVFQFPEDAVLLRLQRKECVSIWIFKSYTPTLHQLPSLRKLPRHLFLDSVPGCRAVVISGLLLRLANTFEDFPYSRTHLQAETKAVLSGILSLLVIALGSLHNLCLLRKRRASEFVFMTPQLTSRSWIINSTFVIY